MLWLTRAIVVVLLAVRVCFRVRALSLCLKPAHTPSLIRVVLCAFFRAGSLAYAGHYVSYIKTIDKARLGLLLCSPAFVRLRCPVRSFRAAGLCSAWARSSWLRPNLSVSLASCTSVLGRFLSSPLAPFRCVYQVTGKQIWKEYDDSLVTSVDLAYVSTPVPFFVFPPALPSSCDWSLLL